MITLLQLDAVGSAVETGRAIGDVGMMAITAGFFLVLSAILMITCFRWFMSLINDMMKDQKQTMQDLLEETRMQNAKLNEISEGLSPENLLRVKTISNMFFDLSVERILGIIKKVRTENHISDKEATKNKIHTLCANLHEDRNSKFDQFTYCGHKLSYYVEESWTDKVTEIVMSEIYNKHGENSERARTNVEAAYAKIRLEFYNNLMKISH